jgi:hypothetical protein
MDYEREEEFTGAVRLIGIERTSEMRNVNQNLDTAPYCTTSIYEFDEKGNKIKAEHRDTDGEITNQISYEYDEDGRLTYEKSSGGNRSVSGETIYQNGRRAEFRFYDLKGNLRTTTRYLYDTKNRLVYSATFHPNGVLVNKTETIYDRAGGRIEMSSLDELLQSASFGDAIVDANGFQIRLDVERPHYFKVKYGADNNPIVAAYYDQNKILIKKYEFDYSTDGFLKEWRAFAQAASQHPEVRLPGFLSDAFFAAVAAFEYARNGDWNQSLQSVFDLPMESRTVYRFRVGKLVETFYFIFGNLVMHSRLEYGERDELRRETDWIESDGKQIVLREKNVGWEFDENGNWTKQTIVEKHYGTRSFNTVTTAIRNLEYFN